MRGREACAEKRIANDDVGDIAQARSLVERANEREERVLALVENGRIERAEGAREGAAAQPEEHLGDGRPAAREMDARELSAKLVSERVGRLELAGEADGDADRANAGARETRCEVLRHVIEERIAILRCLGPNLFRRE